MVRDDPDRAPGRQIAVIGAGVCDADVACLAADVGRRLAAAGHLLLCGGLGGVMEAAARGAKGAGGTTIGIVPGGERHQANPFVDYEIVTSLGHLRNFVIIHSADGVVALPGSDGTLAEISIARKLGKPLVAVGQSWSFVPSLSCYETSAEAVIIARRGLLPPVSNLTVKSSFYNVR